jgi:hypothetical protein
MRDMLAVLVVPLAYFEQLVLRLHMVVEVHPHIDC